MTQLLGTCFVIVLANILNPRKVHHLAVFFFSEGVLCWKGIKNHLGGFTWDYEYCGGTSFAKWLAGGQILQILKSREYFFLLEKDSQFEGLLMRIGICRFWPFLARLRSGLCCM